MEVSKLGEKDVEIFSMKKNLGKMLALGRITVAEPG